jgi:adenylate cyclase
MTEKRKLAAILAADVVGFSRLTGSDEEGTLARLRTLWSDLIAPTIAVHNGRVVKRTGDGSIVEFRSVVDAVRCAIEVQNGMVERNAGLPPERRIEFRVGIHLGDVVEESDGDLMGDGVNIAARLEGIAEPGGVSLSASAHDQVQGKVDAAFADMGEQKLKNIERPVRTFRVLFNSPKAISLLRSAPLGRKQVGAAVLAGILALMAIGGGATWWWKVARYGVVEQRAERGATKKVAQPSQRPTVAVLPFLTLSTQPGDDYFGDGLTEDIISALGQFPELAVLARNAVFPYKGKQLRTEELGRELGARYLIQGSVRRSPEHVRVTVQLADASTGRLLWSTQYDNEPKGIFSIQDDITRQVTGALAVRLSKLEQERSAAKPPNDLEAYELGLRGREMMARHTRSANIEARSLFQRAIDIDPGYAAAYVGLGQGYLLSVLRGWTDQPVETLKRVQNLATTAIGLDGSSTGAHALLASVNLQFRLYDQAIDELNLAINLNPSDAETYAWLGNALLFTGALQGAIEASETALHFDPNLDVHHLWDLGTAYFLAGRMADATRVMEQTAARDPGYVFARVMLAAAYSESARPEDAARAVAAVRKLDPFFDTGSFGSLFRDSEHRAKIASALRKAGL